MVTPASLRTGAKVWNLGGHFAHHKQGHQIEHHGLSRHHLLTERGLNPTYGRAT